MKLLSILALTFVSALLSWQTQAEPQFVPGRLLVKVQKAVTDTQRAQLFESYGVTQEPAELMAKLGIYAVKVPVGEEDEFVRRLSGHPYIEFAEKEPVPPPPSATPNDTSYGSQWHLPKINAPAAWDITQGSSSVYVAVIDTGVEATHPDLTGKVETSLGRNTAQNNSDTTATYHHGTQVAGIIGATTNNGTGVAGVGWNTKIIPIRTTISGATPPSWTPIINGIIWAADNGAKVVNVSSELSDSCSIWPSINIAAKYLWEKGGLLVFSAGNQGTEYNCPRSKETLIVGATSTLDARESYSATGQFLDIMAPGTGIYTTTTGSTYGTNSGTSFAAPVVAGVAALMAAANPTISPAQIDTILKGTAYRPPSLGTVWPTLSYGYGRVDAEAAVAGAVAAASEVDRQPPEAHITTYSRWDVVAGTDTVKVDLEDNVGIVETALFTNKSNVPVATNTVPPFDEFSWNTVTAGDGPVAITVRAKDPAGNWGESSPPTWLWVDNGVIKDTTPPTGTVLSPANYSTVSGKIELSVRGTDPEGLEETVLMVDGLVVSVNMDRNTQQDVLYTWNADKASSGIHFITVMTTNKNKLTGGQTVIVTK